MSIKNIITCLFSSMMTKERTEHVLCSKCYGQPTMGKRLISHSEPTGSSAPTGISHRYVPAFIDPLGRLKFRPVCVIECLAQNQSRGNLYM